MPTSKPKLPQLKTPVTGTFPSELSALSARTPISAKPDFIKEEYTKTPISPPMAYMDFLRSMSAGSPVAGLRQSESSTPEAPNSESAPSTASSEQTDCSCKCDNHKAHAVQPSTLPPVPMSAPPMGATSFSSLYIPPSPAISNMDSPMSATTARSPFSARSVRSPFDWEAALKARYTDCKAGKSGRTSVRHIREVVTRTVTYTPRMNPAPKGKRRKAECSKAQAQVAVAAAAAAMAAAGTTAVAKSSA